MKKQIKIAYFPSNSTKDKVLGSNGKSLDRYCIKCEPEEDLSTGNYVLDATFLIEDNLQDLLQEEVILKVLMDYGEEIFRISKVTVGTRYIDVVARQITIAESLTLWLEDVRPTNLNGQGAVTWMLDKAEGKKEIEIISDIETTATAYYQRMSLYKALHDNDNSLLKRWGGEIQRRGYTIYINKRIGIDRGVTIREGKNLTGFDCTSNIDNLVTRACGEGYNGILGNYIDSPVIGAYNRIYTSVIKYDDVKVKDENNDEGFDTLEQAKAELDRRIKEEYSKNSIDKIKASYNINFVQLEKTEQYKNYIIAERVYIGDEIRVYIPRLKIDIKVRAMIKKYDVLAQKTKETKLSNYIEVKVLSIKQIVDRLNTIDSTETILQQAKDNASLLIKSGLKNSYVIVRENEIIIGDTKDINTMTKVWRWNNQGLGYSSTGYNGTYGTAITNDGKIVADFITTGILNAGLIRAGILKSVNGITFINMEDGTFNFGDKIKFDGTNLIINAKNFITDDQGNTSFTGRLQPNDNTISLFGAECKIDGSGSAIRLQLNANTYVAIDSAGLRLYNQHSQNGTKYTSIIYEADGHTQIFNDATMIKLLSGTVAEVQSRNTGDTGYGSFAGNAFRNMSSRKYKTNIENTNIDYLKVLKENSVKKYQLKDDIDSGDKLGFILEDLTEEAKRYLNPNGTEGIDIYSMCSMLWAIVQEQQKSIEELEGGK